MAGVPFSTDCEGGMFGLYFAEKKPQSFADMMASRTDLFPHFPRHAGRRRLPRAIGVRGGFVSAAHSADDVVNTIAAAQRRLNN